MLLSRAAHWGTAGTREGWVARKGPIGARYPCLGTTGRQTVADSQGRGEVVANHPTHPKVGCQVATTPRRFSLPYLHPSVSP